MHEELIPLDFALDDRVGRRPISPTNVDLPTLRKFLEEVETLIKGDSTTLDLKNTRVTLEDGSLKVVAAVAALTAMGFKSQMG